MNTIMILDEISRFIHNQGDELNLEEMIPLDQIRKVFEKQGYKWEDLKDDGNLNGWSVDFWYYFSHPEKIRYCVSGSLWYGGFKIYKNAKEDI